MNPMKAIYTEKNNCQDCYKCIRHCPVKAIKIEDHSASIVYDLCIYCGKCTTICPVGAKKVRNDVSEAKYLLKGREKVILSLAPSYVNEFPEFSQHQLIEAITTLGFYGVSETALGAELVVEQVKLLRKDNHSAPAISSCCPTIVELVRKYYPHLVHYITPVVSPMEAHARMLKKQYGEDIKVIFAGPCIAKKTELEQLNNAVDVALTFQELDGWLKEEGFTPDFFMGQEDNVFIPRQAKDAALFPVDGGMISNLKNNAGVADDLFMSFSGIQNVRSILADFDNICHENIFLELMACEGGCINGPAKITASSPAHKRFHIISDVQKLQINNQPDPLPDKMILSVPGIDNQCVNVFNEKEIREALQTVGKVSAKDELNCGGCGYDSCREFAKAMLEGKAERQMCVSYMRRVAQNKATVLLQKIPYGVVMVDEHMRIIESNATFAEMLGKEGHDLFTTRPRLEGAMLEKLVPFSKLFDTVLTTGADSIEKDIRMNEKMLQISVFTIQKNKIVCGIIHDMKKSVNQVEMVEKRLRKVMLDNMATAQKAAFLLGENVSQTETILNSVMDLFDNENRDE